jgi:hypothetical protein
LNLRFSVNLAVLAISFPQKGRANMTIETDLPKEQVDLSEKDKHLLQLLRDMKMASYILS